MSGHDSHSSDRRVTQLGQRKPAGQQVASLRDYRLLLVAFFTSTLGDWLYKIALPLLVLQMTGSALQTAIVYTLEYLPYLLFALPGGIVADRADRRILLIRADLAAAVVIGTLAILLWYDLHQLWMVYLAAFVLSGITPLYHASFQGLLPRTVTPDRLSWANSRLQATQSALDLAGPLLGASAVAALGAAWALSLDSASFALSSLAVALIARAVADRAPTQRATALGDLRAAVSFLRSTPALLWGALLAAGSTFGLIMVETNMITYLVQFRDSPVSSVGIVFAALGAGALCGALLAPRILRALPAGPAIIASMIGGGGGTALLLLSQSLPTIAMTWVMVGAFTMVFTVSFYTLRHQLVPENMLGRIVVITRLMAFISLPVAPLVGGALLSATGDFWPVIALSAVVQTGVGVIAWFTPLRTATGSYGE